MKICVFCSSSKEIKNSYIEQTKFLAELMLKNNHQLVHGGGGIGLMGVLSDTYKKNNGHSIGIIPERLNLEGIASKTDTQLIVTPNMHERKLKMRELSDAFITLPGGFGTLEELLEIITLKQLQYHNKPIVILNIENFYSDLFKQFDHFFNEKFAKENFKNLYLITKSVNEAISYIQDYQEFKHESKWF